MFIYMYELENMLLQMQEHLEKVVTQAKADLNTKQYQKDTSEFQ